MKRTLSVVFFFLVVGTYSFAQALYSVHTKEVINCIDSKAASFQSLYEMDEVSEIQIDLSQTNVTHQVNGHISTYSILKKEYNTITNQWLYEVAAYDGSVLLMTIDLNEKKIVFSPLPLYDGTLINEYKFN